MRNHRLRLRHELGSDREGYCLFRMPPGDFLALSRARPSQGLSHALVIAEVVPLAA
jgi:hypothetical protein